MIPPTWRLALSRDMKRVRNNGGGGGGMEIVAFYRSVNRLVARVGWFRENHRSRRLR